MGYTHYFENIQKLEKARITRTVDRFTTAVALLSKEIDGELLSIAPNPNAEGTKISVNGNSFVFGPDFINFEGQGFSSGGEDLAHETLDPEMEHQAVDLLLQNGTQALRSCRLCVGVDCPKGSPSLLEELRENKVWSVS